MAKITKVIMQMSSGHCADGRGVGFGDPGFKYLSLTSCVTSELVFASVFLSVKWGESGPLEGIG